MVVVVVVVVPELLVSNVSIRMFTALHFIRYRIFEKPLFDLVYLVLLGFFPGLLSDLLPGCVHLVLVERSGFFFYLVTDEDLISYLIFRKINFFGGGGLINDL